MSVDQTVINSRALIAAAAKLEAKGYDGDSYRFVEGLVLSVLADGYRRLEPVPDLRPATIAPDDSPGRREFAAARQALANRVKESKA
jgi:hypothetical protein